MNDDRFPQYDEQYLNSNELHLSDEQEATLKLKKALWDNIAHHNAIVKKDSKELNQIHKDEKLLISKKNAYLSLRDVIHITEFILDTGKPAKAAFVDCEKYFQHDKGWADQASTYVLKFGYMEKALKYCEKNKYYLLLEKHKFLNERLILSQNKYTSSLVELKRQRNISVRFNEMSQASDEKSRELTIKNLEIDNLKSQLVDALSMHNRERVKLLKSLNPNVTNIDIGRKIGISRPTVQKYLDDD